MSEHEFTSDKSSVIKAVMMAKGLQDKVFDYGYCEVIVQADGNGQWGASYLFGSGDDAELEYLGGFGSKEDILVTLIGMHVINSPICTYIKAKEMVMYDEEKKKDVTISIEAQKPPEATSLYVIGVEPH